MNEDICKYIINLHNKRTFINEWLSNKYKEKSLYIYGNPGIGKTTIANYILKDWVKLHIKSDFCKSSTSFEDFINDSLYKKSITMMFDKNIYKALIIDDIYYIQMNDKKLFKSIINFSKKKIKNHPIIYIFNNINHKNFKIIIKKSFPFKIDIGENQLIKITKNFFIKDKKKNNEMIRELVKKSNNNLHNIIVNIHFYKDNFENIKEYDTYNTELSEHIKILYNKKTISELYNNSYTDYNIIGLNILENFHIWIKKLDDKKKILITKQIYELLSISEIYSSMIHENNNWNYIDNIITCNIVFPIIILKKYNVSIGSIIYNKYISKCIIHIHNCKLLNIGNIDTNILYFLYRLIENYYKINDNDNDKCKIKRKILDYIHYYKIPSNISEKFLKFFLKDIDKKKIKIFYKL